MSRHPRIIFKTQKKENCQVNVTSKVKIGKGAHEPKVQTAGAYPGFHNKKQV